MGNRACSCDAGWIIADGVAIARCTSCAGPRRAAADGTVDELAGGKLRRLDIAAMRSSPPPPVDWIVDGLVARANVTLLAGREGLGKSLLSAAITAALARGGDTVAGMRCHGDGVVVIDAENGPLEVARRAHALDLGDQGVTYLEPAAGEFDLVADYRGLREVVQAAAPSLLVLDSLRTLWPGDEYHPREGALVAAALSRLARACDCGVLVLHGVSRSSGEYSGNTALGHGVQLVFTMRRDQHDTDRGRRVLRCHKARVGREPDDRWLTIDHADGRVALRAADRPEDKGQQKGHVAPVAHATRATDWLAMAQSALRDGPLDRAALAAAIGTNPRSGSFKRALAAWVSDGQVQRLDRGVYAVPDDPAPAKGQPKGQMGQVGPLGRGARGQGAEGPWPLGPTGPTEGPTTDGPSGPNHLRVVHAQPAAQRDMEARP